MSRAIWRRHSHNAATISVVGSHPSLHVFAPHSRKPKCSSSPTPWMPFLATRGECGVDQHRHSHGQDGDLTVTARFPTRPNLQVQSRLASWVNPNQRPNLFLTSFSTNDLHNPDGTGQTTLGSLNCGRLSFSNTLFSRSRLKVNGEIEESERWRLHGNKPVNHTNGANRRPPLRSMSPECSSKDRVVGRHVSRSGAKQLCCAPPYCHCSACPSTSSLSSFRLEHISSRVVKQAKIWVKEPCVACLFVWLLVACCLVCACGCVVVWLFGRLVVFFLGCFVLFCFFLVVFFLGCFVLFCFFLVVLFRFVLFFCFCLID